MTPRFEHDGCPGCGFVGMFGKEDVWLCGTTLMRRYSSEPSHYLSIPIPIIDQLNLGDERNRWNVAFAMAFPEFS